jgi:predicted dehydrogenase
VLCEKPLAPDPATARAMRDACVGAGVLLAEAWMTPFDPRWEHALRLARSGEIGDVVEIEASFTFTIPATSSENFRWRSEFGGGALLDVGVYCLGAAVELWGPDATVDHAELVPSTDPDVDTTTVATLSWPGDVGATIRCSFVEPERQRLVYRGTAGRIVLDGDAFTGGGELIVVERDRASDRRTVVAGDPYLAMVERFAAVVAGRAEWPRPVERSIEVLDLLDRIRRAARTSPS